MACEIGVWLSTSSASASHSLGGPLLVSEGGSILVSAEAGFRERGGDSLSTGFESHRSPDGRAQQTRAQPRRRQPRASACDLDSPCHLRLIASVRHNAHRYASGERLLRHSPGAVADQARSPREQQAVRDETLEKS